jgi:sulfur carrier protein
MEIYINNDKKEIPADSTVSSLIKILSLENVTGIALAVNNKVVPKTEWTKYILTENDKILVIKASKGG